MYKYTLAFIKRKDEVLMLNRNKSPWMGSWNGIGGKREVNESGLSAIKREIYEETGIKVNDKEIVDKGIVTWNSYDENGNGLHLFLVEISDDFIYETPRVVKEGILDWKKINWISNYDNYGVCHNIPYFINYVIFDSNKYNHKCIFKDKVLLSVKNEILNESMIE